MKLRKLVAGLMIGTAVIGLASCHREIPQGPQNTEGDNTTEKTELKINYAAGNALKTITFNTGTPIKLPNGDLYTNGKLKPIWDHISNKLDVKLTDVTSQGQKAVEMIKIAAATDFSEADIFGGNVAEQFMQYGATGKLVNLMDHKDKLPNFTKFLEKYPLIKKQISAYDGGIYHIPYIAEMEEFSKVFFGRENWITELLDSSKKQAETKTLDVNYQGYWKGDKKRNNQNIIELQNNAAVNGKLDGATARDLLIKYIDDNYPELEKRSDLYLGSTAKYDVDELIALWRVMRLHPNTLYELTTGQKGTCDIIPYFFRTKNNREEIYKFINYFGGTRVYGTNTYIGKWFADENNELQYTFYQDEVFEGIDHLSDIFAEGLINPDYDDLLNSANYRTVLYSQDKKVDSAGKPTAKQLGFMTFDFIPSTAAASPEGVVKAMLPPVTKLPAYHDDEFRHFVEIPRTVMIEGWSISKHCEGAKLDKALELFDFFFSEEGDTIQNFGIPGMTCDTENLYTLPSGEKVPTVSPWIMEQAKKYTKGDVAVFAQQYMGIRLAIGYKANVGFEYQNMTDQAKEGYDLYKNCGVLTLGYNNESMLMQLSAPCYSLTKQEQARLNMLSIGDDQLAMSYAYIKGSDNAPKSVAEIKKSYENADVEELISIYRAAYDRTKNL